MLLWFVKSYERNLNKLQFTTQLSALPSSVFIRGDLSAVTASREFHLLNIYQKSCRIGWQMETTTRCEGGRNSELNEIFKCIVDCTRENNFEFTLHYVLFSSNLTDAPSASEVRIYLIN